MTDNQQRRDFLKTATATAAGLAAGAIAGERRAQAQAVPLNPAAKAVLPDGRVVDRQQILDMLGLDRNVSPESWLTFIGCNKNASALKTGDANTLLDKKAIDRSMLSPVQLRSIDQIRKK
jgi:TAT (twin-arginine translocation) pathway signal sequence